jgi:hypothetical protein
VSALQSVRQIPPRTPNVVHKHARTNPHASSSISSSDIKRLLPLQQTVGNRAVAHLIENSSSASGTSTLIASCVPICSTSGREENASLQSLVRTPKAVSVEDHVLGLQRQPLTAIDVSTTGQLFRGTAARVRHAVEKYNESIRRMEVDEGPAAASSMSSDFTAKCKERGGLLDQIMLLLSNKEDGHWATKAKWAQVNNLRLEIGKEREKLYNQMPNQYQDAASSASAASAMVHNGADANQEAVSSGGSASIGFGQPAGWILDKVKSEAEKLGLDGVCDALSTASLMGVTLSRDGTGINDENWHAISNLKHLLVNISAAANQLGPDDLTFAFLQFASLKRYSVESLKDLTGEVATAALQAFLSWYRSGYSPPEGLHTKDGSESEDDSDTEDESRSGVLEGPYTHMSRARIQLHMGLGLPLNLGQSFQGIVRFDVWSKERPRAKHGHQLAVRYTSSKAGDGGRLMIVDQNVGPREHFVETVKDVQRVLAEHLFRTYVSAKALGTDHIGFDTPRLMSTN